MKAEAQAGKLVLFLSFKKARAESSSVVRACGRITHVGIAVLYDE